MINQDPHKKKVKITRFFNKIKKPYQKSTYYYTTNYFHQKMKNTIIKIINDFIQAKDLVLTEMTNQVFSNHFH